MNSSANKDRAACVDVLRMAILEARIWGWEGNVDAERLGDLMDAVHNIPSLIANWNANGVDDIKREIETYERKWGQNGGPCLRTRFETVVNTGDSNNMDELTYCSFPFPIADTEEHPRIKHFLGSLELTFVDYTNEKRVLNYTDVVYFGWSSIDSDPRDLQDDQSYIVKNSSMIKRLTETKDIDDPTNFTHQIVCFNETGQFLEIVYRTLNPTA